MERGEPTFAPEWYKGGGGGSSCATSSNNHRRSSSNSDDHDRGFPSRSRSSVSVDRSLSSSRQNSKKNGSVSHDNDNPSRLRPYGSFGRSHRDRDREKDVDFRRRDRSLFENGASDSFRLRTEKDTLRRSHSMVSGRRGESWAKGPTKELSNGVQSAGSMAGGIRKGSFEREFPSLGADEHHGHSDISRAQSPGLGTNISSLPIGSSAVLGSNGWTSALVDLPAKVGGSEPVPSSASQATTDSVASTPLSISAGLNMAEALAQPPSQVRDALQLSADTQRIEELTRIQYSKLIPVRPSTPKSSILNPSDKSKFKAPKSVELNAPVKVGQQSTRQLVIPAIRAPVRSDTPKTSQSGNFQVLNRERNGVSPTAKDGSILTNASVVPPAGVPLVGSIVKSGNFSATVKVGHQSSSQLVKQTLSAPVRSDISKVSQTGNFLVLNRERNGVLPSAKDGTYLTNGSSVNPVSGVPAAMVPSLKRPINPKVKSDSKGMLLNPSQNPFGEKRSLSQAKNRNEFFNSLRKKAAVNDSTGISEPSCTPSPSNSEKSSQSAWNSSDNQEEKELDVSCPAPDCLPSEKGPPGNCDAPEESPKSLSDNLDDSFLDFVPTEEEAKFLRLLGWNEEDNQGILTDEEIQAFLNEHGVRLNHKERRGETTESGDYL